MKNPFKKSEEIAALKAEAQKKRKAEKRAMFANRFAANQDKEIKELKAASGNKATAAAPGSKITEAEAKAEEAELAKLNTRIASLKEQLAQKNGTSKATNSFVDGLRAQKANKAEKIKAMSKLHTEYGGTTMTLEEVQTVLRLSEDEVRACIDAGELLAFPRGRGYVFSSAIVHRIRRGLTNG